MVQNHDLCEFLPWDTEFFGWRIARVKSHHLDASSVDDVLDWCANNKIGCLYFLGESNDAQTVRVAEDHGFRLVDIKVTLEARAKTGFDTHLDNPTQAVLIRTARPSDTGRLRAIARTAYYASRFFSDPCFSQESCQALYATWIERSVEGYADIVFVAEAQDQLVGYISCQVDKETGRGTIGLVGVDPQYQGKGVGKALIHYSLKWFDEQGVEVVNVTTQGSNIAAQRLYQRCGFLTLAVQLWYHKWFIDCEPALNESLINLEFLRTRSS